MNASLMVGLKKFFREGNMRLKNIVDTIYKCRGFKITVILMVDRDETVNDKFKATPIIQTYPDYSNKNFKTISLDTYGKAIIGFQKQEFDNESKKFIKSIGSFFTQKQFPLIADSLNICLDWLKLDSYRHLFRVDGQNKLIGLGTPAPYNPTVNKNDFEYIQFYPAAIRDSDTGILHEGISIRNQAGPIIAMYAEDFVAMSYALKNYMKNIYSNNLLMLNLGLNIMKGKS